MAGDSYDKLILLFNENLNDSSNRNHTVVNNGNATISTSVKKYGSGSLSIPATEPCYILIIGNVSDFDLKTNSAQTATIQFLYVLMLLMHYN